MESNDMTTEQSTNLSDKEVNNNLPMFCETFGFLSSASSIGLIITNPDGTIISFNKTVQELLGISIEECGTMNISELYVDPNARQHMLDMLAKTTAIRNFETKLKHKDKTLRTVLANIDYIEFNNTNMLLTSLYDITQYKQTHERPKETDKSYKTLFKNAPVGITVTDHQGNLIVGNNAIQELLGYSADELKGISVQDFYLIKAERQQLLDLTERLGNVRDFEAMYRHKDGNAISVLINTDKIDFKNQKDMLLTSIRDISNLKQIEAELTKERDFSNAILNIAASLIVVFDRNGTITRFNRACEQTTGYSFDEMRGTHFGDATYIDPEITREKVAKLLNGDYPCTHETVWFSKNREKHLISWTDTTLLNKEGQAEYVIATGIDISERQQAEDKLKRANADLASWVKELQERTEELNLLNEMGEQLQSCQTIAEACAISTQYIKRICPASHGALYLINESKTFAEAAEMWGDPAFTQKLFAPLSCWAMRARAAASS